MWPEKDIEYVKLKDDDIGRHFGLFVSDELVSVISIFANRSSVQFRKFATLQELQGKGYGTMLLNFVLEEAKIRGAKIIWCNARKSKMDFYKRFGLEETGDAIIKAGIEYVMMSKKM
ncbi:MAG: family acetyltransferase [Pelosinus sp.]|jgi:GNAT superfamily N-acetyltransferase|nr:family acetyltransferase [Pelosinus sp.]